MRICLFMRIPGFEANILERVHNPKTAYLCQGSNPLKATNVCYEFEFHSVCHTRKKKRANSRNED